MQKKVLNRLRDVKEIAAEIQCTREGYRKWIGVFPLEQDAPKPEGWPAPKGRYKVLVFEVREELLDTDDVWSETMENVANRLAAKPLKGFLHSEGEFAAPKTPCAPRSPR